MEDSNFGRRIDNSVSNMLASQACKPEFDPQKPQKKKLGIVVCNLNAGETKTAVCWSTFLAKSVSLKLMRLCLKKQGR